MDVQLTAHQTKYIQPVLDYPSFDYKYHKRGIGVTTAMLLASILKAKQLGMDYVIFVTDTYMFNHSVDTLKRLARRREY